jgi:hypothetical protein
MEVYRNYKQGSSCFYINYVPCLSNTSYLKNHHCDTDFFGITYPSVTSVFMNDFLIFMLITYV